MRHHQTWRIGKSQLRGIPAALASALVLIGQSPAPADTYRVKAERGTFLVETEGSDYVVRAEGDDLVISKGGDEYRLKLDASRADPTSREPLLTIRHDGKTIISARRLATAPASPLAGGPGRTVLNPRALRRAWSLAITPDGRTLVSGDEGFLRVWDPITLTERYNISTAKTGRRVSLTPNGSTIASAEYAFVNGKPIGNVVIRDGKTGQAIRTMPPVEALHCVAIDPTGKVVVSSSWSESFMRVWDVDKGEQVGTLKGHTGVVGTVVYSPDGKTLASGGDTTVRLWDADTGQVRKILRGHQGSVESVAFSGDGKTLASGGFDDDARVWDVETGKVLATLECDDPVLAVALSADGKLVATAAARWGSGFYGAAPAQVRVWDVATGKPVATLPEQPGQVFSLVFKPDGKSLITASLSGAVTLWDLATFQASQDGNKGAEPSNRR